MTKTINGNWEMEKDEVIEGDLIVKGNISGKDGIRYALKVIGNINAGNINAGNINAGNINAGNIDAWNIDAWNIDAWDIRYYAVCFAYRNIKCKSIKGRRENCKHFVLDGKIEVGK